MLSPVPLSHDVYRGLVALLRHLDVEQAETVVSCSKCLAETPPTFVIHADDEVQDLLANALSLVLQREVPAGARCTVEADEAAHLAQLAG